MTDADRIEHDPVTRWIIGGKAVESGGVLAGQFGLFEAELLAINKNSRSAGRPDSEAEGVADV